jgi:hypothetical protein
MLRAPDFDISLATSLLQTVRDDAAASELWCLLTAEWMSDCWDSNRELMVQRLRHTNAAYPLRRIEVFNASSQLLSALGESTTIESVYLGSRLPNEFRTQMALQLKAMPSLCKLNLNHFPIDVGLELLQSRTNWQHICLPNKTDDYAKASALAACNKTAFELQSDDCGEESDSLRLWLANPNLTALRVQHALSSLSSLDGLCSNLTTLVRLCGPFLPMTQ